MFKLTCDELEPIANRELLSSGQVHRRLHAEQVSPIVSVVDSFFIPNHRFDYGNSMFRRYIPRAFLRSCFFLYLLLLVAWLQLIEPSCSSGFDSNDDYDYDGLSRGSFLNL